MMLSVQPATRGHIAPQAESRQRPLWSVMIPTYNPNPAYLRETVRSVLDQAPGPDRMEIVVVDGKSAAFDPRTFLQESGAADRVTFAQGAQGIGPNWNCCVTKAQGRWIHLLHQDDRALAGFYERCEAAIERDPELGAACSACALANEQDRWTSYMKPDAPRGVLRSWQQDVFERLRIAAPAMVVKRSVYETLGGFDTSYRYALDWDMWKRIAVHYPIWYEPEPGIVHRVHGESTTRALQGDAENMREIQRSIAQSQAEFGDRLDPGVETRARRAYARFGVESALKLLLHARDVHAARCQLREACALSSASTVAALLFTETMRSALWRIGPKPARAK